MLIGLISDIHGPLPESAADALSGVDRIICAGDVEMPQTIWELDAIAPTIAVLGNCDRYVRYAIPNIPMTANPLLGGLRFFVVHRPQDIGTPAEDVRIVVHGHTHVPRNDLIGGVRYVNPGSPCFPRGGSTKTVALMQVEDGRMADLRFMTL